MKAEDGAKIISIANHYINCANGGTGSSVTEVLKFGSDGCVSWADNFERPANDANSRIAFTLDAFTTDQIKDFNRQDFEDFNNFLEMANKLDIEQKNKIRTIIDNVSNDLNKLVSKPEKYKENYAKIINVKCVFQIVLHQIKNVYIGLNKIKYLH